MSQDNSCQSLKARLMSRLPISTSHFVASVVGMPNLTVEGRTEQEAMPWRSP